MWKKIVDYYKIPEAAKEPSTDSARFKNTPYFIPYCNFGIWYVLRLSFKHECNS